LTITGNYHKLKQNLTQSADQLDVCTITSKNHLDIQLTTQFHHLEPIQKSKEPQRILILLKECTIINGNSEHHTQRPNGIILLKILFIILSPNLIKTSKIHIQTWEKQSKDLITIGNFHKLEQNQIQYAHQQDVGNQNTLCGEIPKEIMK
jgi:hypothetical protein